MAILIEPVQGEAGVVVPPAGYLKKVRELTAANNILFIADEIQSGFGRTGKFFCYEHEGIRPDMLVVGKALSGGYYPISAVLADNEVMGVFRPGDHGSTYGGNPLASAIAIASLDVLIDEKLTENSAKLGVYLLEELKTIQNPLIEEIRGKGLFVGIQLKPEAGGARKYCEKLMDLGVLCKETHQDTIRIAPPLTITKDELDIGIAALKKVLA